MSNDDELPTLREALGTWLGVKLPSIPLPQTIGNLDKAIGKVVLAGGENLEARIRGNTLKAKARGKIDVEGLFRTEEEKRKLENRAAAASAAIEDIQTTPGDSDAASEIDDDWLNLFARLAEDKSSEELQVLFGRILAGEIRKPGSFSLRTVQLMAIISRREAEAVATFLPYALNGQIVPFRTLKENEAEPTWAIRLLMVELGIAGNPVPVGGVELPFCVDPHSSNILGGSRLGILIENDSSKQITFSLSGQPLTQAARELIPIAHLKPTDLKFLKEIAWNIYYIIMGAHSAEVDAISVHVVRTMPMPGNQLIKYDKVLSIFKP